MRYAIDSKGQRICADDSVKYTDCFCDDPKCHEPLIHKKGNRRIPHFAHKPNSACRYAEDKDCMSKWHRRMEDYFPVEYREQYVFDKDGKDYRRADIYIPEANMVLEFQHSPISDADFWYRTLFYMQNDMRVVWLYDEESGKREYGRFKLDNNHWKRTLYENKWYKWLYSPRTYVPLNNDLIRNRVGICVYTGTEGDVFHRIIDSAATYDGKAFEYVEFSLNDIHMSKDMDVEEFFKTERKEKNNLYFRWMKYL